MSLIPQNLVSDFKEMFHGGLDDTQAFLYMQFASLREDVKSVRDAVDNLDTREEWVKRPVSGEVSAGGTVDIPIRGPRPGFMLIVTRLTVVVPGGSGSSAVLYDGSVSQVNAVTTIDDADFFADDVVEIPVFPGTDLTLAVTGAPAGARVAVIIRGKEMKSGE